MTDVVLASKLAEAMELAIAIRDHTGRQHYPVLLVAALNDCFAHIYPDLDARHHDFREVLARIKAEGSEPSP
jgi:hypothetical protein